MTPVVRLVRGEIHGKEFVMKSKISLLFGATFALAGCVDGQRQADDGTYGSHAGLTGIEVGMVVDTSTDLDVAFVQYGIARVACVAGEDFEPLSRDIRVDLQSMLLPGGIPAWENSPLDMSSEHRFADHFEVLPTGCYDVTATPLTATGSASAECAAAFANDVTVVDGRTTEVFMISQCKGEEVGSIDAVVALNRPPTLVDLDFNPSKFIRMGDKTTVCVTATDPDGDPLEIEWDQIGGSLCGSTVISSEINASGLTQCVDILPEEAGDYLFEVRIYDMLRDEHNTLIRIEQWLNDHGYPNTSHDSLRFPVYVGE
jgi:hypothetical protein